MQKFNEPLLGIDERKSAAEIKVAINNAFPLKRFITFVAKCEEVELEAGSLLMHFSISKYYTTEPNYNPLIFPYLFFVDDDEEFVQWHTSKTVVCAQTHVFSYDF